LRPSATIKLDGEEHDPSNYICIEALGQGAFPPNTLSNFASGYDDVRKSSENAFHMRYRDQADRANPTALTTEFGGSAFPGGSEKQIESSQLKKPFLLNSTDPERNPEAAAFWNAHGPTIIKAMWEASARRYPELAKLQKEKLRGHGIFDTGFAKATVADGNATTMHLDDENRLKKQKDVSQDRGTFRGTSITCTLAFAVGDAPLEGGHHVLLSTNYDTAVVVEDSVNGMLLMGDYATVAHGNFMTQLGSGTRRFIVNAYVNSKVVVLLEKLVDDEVVESEGNSEGLSDYEMQRLRNIERNQEILRELGLA